MNTFAGTVFAVQHGNPSSWEREAVAVLYAPADDEKENIHKPAAAETETPEAEKKDIRLFAGFLFLLILGSAIYGNG